MIHMKPVEKKNGVKNQFVIKTDEPVTIEYIETENGHTVAHVYRTTETDEYSEPVGAYDSAVEPTEWKA